MDHHHELDLTSMTIDDIVAGGFAGVAEHLGMFPFDTIKTRMQSEGGNVSFRSVVTTMLRNERWTHLYRGCVPVLCSAVPAHGAYFSIYEGMKRYMGGKEDVRNIIVSAACATTAHDAVTIPFDVVKQRMQIDAANVHRSSWQCFQSVVRSEGARALFRALPTTTMMNIPHVSMQWFVYERLKEWLVSRGEVENELAVHFVAAGLLAGASAAAVSTPMDNVKTMLQLGKHRSAAETVRWIYMAHGGLRGFFVGVVPRMLHMAPSAAITLSTFELVKSIMAARHHHSA